VDIFLDEVGDVSFLSLPYLHLVVGKIRPSNKPVNANEDRLGLKRRKQSRQKSTSVRVEGETRASRALGETVSRDSLETTAGPG
jgi:hypothetical protein